MPFRSLSTYSIDARVGPTWEVVSLNMLAPEARGKGD